MVLNPGSQLREVSGLSPDELALIRAFIQGAVYSWVKNRKGEWFALRDLVGGENFDWGGTPLQPLYDKHIAAGKSEKEAMEAAAIDIGWIAKSVLEEDRRTFSVDAGYVNKYRWDGQGP